MGVVIHRRDGVERIAAYKDLSQGRRMEDRVGYQVEGQIRSWMGNGAGKKYVSDGQNCVEASVIEK
jgi:hypothetical protein